MNRSIQVVVFAGVILAPLSVHAAETVKGAVMTHQGANMQAGQQLTKEKPPSSPDSSGMMMHSVPSSMKPQQAPVTVKETKVPSQSPPLQIEPEVVNVPPPTMKQPAPSTAVQPKPADQAGQAAMVPRDAGLDNLAAIRDAQQARMFEEARQAADALRELANIDSLGDGVNPDLGLGERTGDGIGGRAVDMSKLPGHDVAGLEMPEGSLSMPDLPDNQDQGPSGNAFKPSGDLRGAMAGAAGQDTVQLEPQEMDTSNITTRHDQNPDGGHTDFVATTNASDGSVITASYTYDSAGKLVFEQFRTLDRHGNILWETNRDYVNRTSASFSPVHGGLDRMQDPNNPAPSPEVAAWAARFDHSAKKGAPVIDRVNPGPEGAMARQQAPRLQVPREQLVINPSPDQGGGQAREVSEEQRRIMAGQLRETVKGPGGHPGDDPDGFDPGGIEAASQ